MKQVIKVTKKQVMFYVLVFLFGFVYQPNWVLDNFWLKADFYNSLPFAVPYFVFLAVYSAASVGATWSVVQIVKKHL
jgi:hypothetical protein